MMSLIYILTSSNQQETNSDVHKVPVNHKICASDQNKSNPTKTQVKSVLWLHNQQLNLAIFLPKLSSLAFQLQGNDFGEEEFVVRDIFSSCVR